MRRITVVLILMFLLILIGCQSNDNSLVSDGDVSNIFSDIEPSKETIISDSNDLITEQSNASVSFEDSSSNISSEEISCDQNSSTEIESGKPDSESSAVQEPDKEETSDPPIAENKPEESKPELSAPDEESEEESSVPEISEEESSFSESSEESEIDTSIPEESDLPHPNVSEIPEESIPPEESAAPDTSEPGEVLLTEQDHNRIMSEVIAYAESYAEKGFEFDWNESMTFDWDVGFMGTPRVKYDGVDGVIKTLKHHIDLIYQTSTNPMYGLTTNYMTYKIEQVVVDGDLAYVVIYGG